MIFLKKIVVVCLLIVPLVARTQEEQFIEWSPAKKLTWGDYLASPSSLSDAAAITSTALGIEYHLRNNTLTYKISCRFSKTRSWGKDKTSYILQHEQGHFDITEIFARKLAKEIKQYKFNPRTYQEDLSKLYKKIMEDKEQYQNKYDAETDYSRNREKQTEWLKKIEEELEELEGFASY